MKTIGFRKRLYLIWPDVRFDKKAPKAQIELLFYLFIPQALLQFHERVHNENFANGILRSLQRQ